MAEGSMKLGEISAAFAVAARSSISTVTKYFIEVTGDKMVPRARTYLA
jgi:hypothetical protein